MSRLCRTAVVLLVLVLAPAAPAAANPDFRSVIDSVTPAQPGLKLQVLGFDQNFQLMNRTGKVVVVRGYEGEPYLRLLPDGTVQQNRNSPATYLNEDRYATTTVPKTAGADKPVAWQTLDKTGRVTWHDHRMHWMTTSTPPSVKNESQKTKIFNYKVGLDVGGKPVTLRGTLFWVGPPGGGMPVAAVAALLLLVVGSIALVVMVRRRRSAGTAPPAAGAGEATEAW